MSTSIQNLSVRVRNVLHRMGLNTRSQILHAVKKRVLHPSNLEAFGFGQKSLREVRAWLGLKAELTNLDISRIRRRIVYELRRSGTSYRDCAKVLRMRGPEEIRRLEAKFFRKDFF